MTRRVAELDGLRAIAAMVVMFFHLDPYRYFPGWSGVDLFFVLSGYLITDIIVRDGPGPGFFRNFYARRSLRIWPIYYLTVLTLIAVNPYLHPPAPTADLPYVLTYTENLPRYWHREPPPHHPALDHVWTLSIEEQFYLVWPALVLWAGPRRLPLLCLATVGVSLAARDGNNWLIPRYSERLLIARSDGFALGGLLAWLLGGGGWARDRPERGRRAFGSAVALALLYFAYGCWTEGSLGFVGLPTPTHPAETTFAFAVLYAGIIGLVALNAGSRWLGPLRLGGLVYLGQISYGLYLYHYVVYWAYDGGVMKVAQPWRVQAAKLGISLAVAAASWHLVERPILGLKGRFGYREPAPAGGASGDTPTRTSR